MKINTEKFISTGLKIFEYRRNLSLACITGDYRTYKQIKQEYSSFALQNFDIAKQVKFPKVHFPLFSREGFNMIKISIRDFFSRKTPDERKFVRAIRNEKIKNNYNAELQRLLDEAQRQHRFTA